MQNNTPIDNCFYFLLKNWLVDLLKKKIRKNVTGGEIIVKKKEREIE